jgi:hypothetical protein
MAQTDEQDTTRATNDAYTGMLAISLIALLTGCALLYFDWSQYPTREPPKVAAPAPVMVPEKGAAPQGAVQQPDGKGVPMPPEMK